MVSESPLPLRLPIGMPVLDARAALASSGDAIALVTSRGFDVGVVTAEDLAPDRWMGTASVGDVMGAEIVHIPATTDLHRTLRIYRKAAWSSAIRRRPGDWPARPERAA